MLLKNKDLIPVEVKYQKFTKPEIPNSFKSFLDKIKFKNTTIYFIPLWMV